MLEGTTLTFYEDEKNTSPVVGQANVEKFHLCGESILDCVHSPDDISKLVLIVKCGGGAGALPSRNALHFSCENGQEKDEWIERIQETIESIKRRSEHESMGVFPGYCSVLSTPTTRNGELCMQAGTPASETRRQVSALSSSSGGKCAAFLPFSKATLQAFHQQEQPTREEIESSQIQKQTHTHETPPVPSSWALPTQSSQKLHSPSPLAQTPPCSTSNTSFPQAVDGRYPSAGQQGPQGVHASPIAFSSSQHATPWGKTAEEKSGQTLKEKGLTSIMEGFKPTFHLKADHAGSVHAVDVETGTGMDQTTGAVLAATLQSLPTAAQEKREAAINHPQEASSKRRLTLDALEELEGGKRRPVPDREDIISMQERKERVEEGMRRTSLCNLMNQPAGADRRITRAGVRCNTASQSRHGHQSYQGWVKMFRRKWFMVLLPPGKPVISSAEPEEAVPLNCSQSGKDALPGVPHVARASDSMIVTGMEALPRLALYHSPKDLQNHKPPKEMISLSADSIIDSRRLSTSINPSIATKSSGSKTSSSTKPCIDAAESSFVDTQEPDTVIDILLTSSRTGLLKTYTIQCFSVEEENRWISELQQAIGSLAGDEEYGNSPSLFNGLDGLSHELCEHLMTHTCCILS